MPHICIVIPVYNEEKKLSDSIDIVLKTANEMLKDFEIVIANNGSTDKTLDIAKRISKKYDNVDYIHLNEKGRGRALRKAWSDSMTDVLCYMDVDLSTDIKHLKELVSAVEEGFDIVSGSRLIKGAKINRSFIRNILSRGYIFLLKLALNVPFSDTQCGFKAVNRNVVKNLMPLVENNEWFFDTELLILGNVFGYKIKEIPVKWKESNDSRVDILRTVTSYIKNILKLKRKIQLIYNRSSPNSTKSGNIPQK